MRQNFYVYLWMRKDLYSPFYVGKGKDYRAWDKRKGMKPPKDKNRIRLVKENLTEEEAFELERTLIRFYGRKCDGGILMNLTEGGEGLSGHNHTLETKQIISQKAKERLKDKTNHPRFGVSMSEETKERIREKKKGKLSWNKGVSGYKTQPASEERRLKMGKGCVIMGIHYGTQSHAARALGISSAIVSYRCRSKHPNWNEWQRV